MRVYQDSPRGEYEEVLRSIGSSLDRHNMRDILLVEVEDGFIVRGASLSENAAHGGWGSMARAELRFGEGEVQGELDDAFARRGSLHTSGAIERALRIVGRHIDGLKASDIMAAEQDGDWLLRCLVPGTPRHQLIEFQAADLAQLTDTAVDERNRSQTSTRDQRKKN
jgi:hypothetical protein